MCIVVSFHQVSPVDQIRGHMVSSFRVPYSGIHRNTVNTGRSAAPAVIFSLFTTSSHADTHTHQASSQSTLKDNCTRNPKLITTVKNGRQSTRKHKKKTQLNQKGQVKRTLDINQHKTHAVIKFPSGKRFMTRVETTNRLQRQTNIFSH